MEANPALAANRRSFDGVAVPSDDQQRDQPGLRKIDRVDGCARLIHYFPLREGDLLQVSVQHCKSFGRQGRQEAVVPMVWVRSFGQNGLLTCPRATIDIGPVR